MAFKRKPCVMFGIFNNDVLMDMSNFVLKFLILHHRATRICTKISGALKQASGLLAGPVRPAINCFEICRSHVRPSSIPPPLPLI